MSCSSVVTRRVVLLSRNCRRVVLSRNCRRVVLSRNCRRVVLLSRNCRRVVLLSRNYRRVVLSRNCGRVVLLSRNCGRVMLLSRRRADRRWSYTTTWALLRRTAASRRRPRPGSPGTTLSSWSPTSGRRSDARGPRAGWARGAGPSRRCCDWRAATATSRPRPAPAAATRHSGPACSWRRCLPSPTRTTRPAFFSWRVTKTSRCWHWTPVNSSCWSARRPSPRWTLRTAPTDTPSFWWTTDNTDWRRTPESRRPHSRQKVGRLRRHRSHATAHMATLSDASCLDGLGFNTRT